MPPFPSYYSNEIASIQRDVILPLYGGYRLPLQDEVLLARGNGLYQIYDDLRRDPHCACVLQKREMAVVAREWVVDPASSKRIDKKAADMVKSMLSGLGTRAPSDRPSVAGFDLVCVSLLDAILKGFSVAEIIWARDGGEIYPQEIKVRNQQRFFFVVGDKGKGNYELRLLTADVPEGEAIAQKYPRKFITHTHGARDGNPYGMGIGRSLWFPVHFKQQGVKFWLQFVEKFASPTALGRYERAASEGQKSALMGALTSLSNDTGIILPKDMDISFLEAARSSSITSYKDLAQYMDDEMSKLTLGETLSTQMGNVGSYAASQTHNDVRLELAKADSDLLSDTLNRTLIPWTVELNLPGARPPRLWRKFEEAEDLNTRVNRDKTLSDMGWSLTEKAIVELYGDYYEKAQQQGAQAGVSDEQFLANSGASGSDASAVGAGADAVQTADS